jgi:hypothetical protein
MKADIQQRKISKGQRIVLMNPKAQKKQNIWTKINVDEAE